jgi:ATP/maltotriose-dependent transcriptional regulator MalT
VLICTRRNSTIFSEMFLQDASVAPNLIKAGQKRRFRPLICEAGDGALLGRGAFTRELERIGATQLVAHGTHDAQVNGAAESDRPERGVKSVLTPREQEILRWIYLGKTNGEIGTMLSLSSEGVQPHASSRQSAACADSEPRG